MIGSGFAFLGYFLVVSVYAFLKGIFGDGVDAVFAHKHVDDALGGVWVAVHSVIFYTGMKLEEKEGFYFLFEDGGG